MMKVVSILLDWEFAPSDYLEEQILISEEGISIEMFNGRARATIDPLVVEARPTIIDQLTMIVESRLRAVQIITHKDYSLTRPSRSDLKEDGSRNLYLEVNPAVIKMTAGKIDFIMKDKDGNVITDTKRERLDRQKWFADRVVKFWSVDGTLEKMLTSYQMSVKDPNNEFIYLYEIRDAIASRFESKKNAKKRLGITEKEWNLLGDLSNNEQIRQGRHRGKVGVLLRDADASELENGRRIAVELIEKYIIYLEQNAS